MREDSKTLLPHWKYGHFSILLNTARDERMALYVNHDRMTYTVMEVCHSLALETKQRLFLMNGV